VERDRLWGTWRCVKGRCQFREQEKEQRNGAGTLKSRIAGGWVAGVERKAEREENEGARGGDFPQSGPY